MMTDYNKLCMNCMHEIPDSSNNCPLCGFYNNTQQNAPYLPMKTIISNKYLVGNLIEHNGEGATYMGYDIEHNAPITIREFMPDSLATRNENETQVYISSEKESIFEEYLQNFLDLWRRLARMRGLSSLIVVIDIIESNGTAYAISEYIESCTLRDYLLSSSTGYLSWQDARAMFMPVLSTLANLHSAGIIHRGISPTTLLVGKDKKIRICGFSIWEARASYGELNAELFAGYAAIEQYGFEGQQGPWTDIYSFSAVLYRTLIGSTPLEATTRVTNDKMMIPGAFAEQLPAYVINAIINALQILPEDRTKTVEQFRAELSAAPTVTVTNKKFKSKIANSPKRSSIENTESNKSTSVSKTTKNKKKNKKHKLPPALTAALIVFGVSLLIFLILYLTVLKDKIKVNNNSNITTTQSQKETKIETPNFVGQVFDLVKSEGTYSSKLTLLKVEEYSDKIEKGRIIFQTIKAGTNVPIGTEITLTISKGIEQIKFINVNNMNYDDASAALTEIGFKIEKIEKYNDGTRESNTIDSANLKAGTTYDKGTEVLLQVWGEPPYSSENNAQ